MIDDVRRLRRWLRRAQPPRATLLRALVAGLVASLVNVALFVGAVGLLVESAARPGLRTVLAALIVIELFAFLRSPLRFVERLSAHRLGFAAVSRWRRWLVLSVGAFSYSRWRAYAAGDLLERSLRDTDELQDLWLRCVIPLVTSGVVMLVSDLFIGFMAPHGRWWPYAADLLAVQLVGVAALLANVGPLLRRDRVLRRSRANYRSQLVELSAATPELALLGRSAYAESRSTVAVERLHRAETALNTQHNIANAVAPAMTALALGALVIRPQSASLWIVVAVLLALSTLESLNVVRDALDTAVAVSAAAERLEELEDHHRHGVGMWPLDATLRLDRVSIEEDDSALIRDASMVAAPGRRVAITGPSGSGKSTLLRAIAALDEVAGGAITIGGESVFDIEETFVRHFLAYVASEPGLTRGFAIDVVGLGRSSARGALDDVGALGLVADPTTRWDELSRGERARVAIARAAFVNPLIYLLDEPTSGLGSAETARVLALLEATNATVIVATHDAQVMAWCDAIFELRDQSLIELRR